MVGYIGILVAVFIRVYQSTVPNVVSLQFLAFYCVRWATTTSGCDSTRQRYSHGRRDVRAVFFWNVMNSQPSTLDMYFSEFAIGISRQ